eukprot:2103691-Prymnesium_polylepis.1
MVVAAPAVAVAVVPSRSLAVVTTTKEALGAGNAQHSSRRCGAQAGGTTWRGWSKISRRATPKSTPCASVHTGERVIGAVHSGCWRRWGSAG